MLTYVPCLLVNNCSKLSKFVTVLRSSSNTGRCQNQVERDGSFPRFSTGAPQIANPSDPLPLRDHSPERSGEGYSCGNDLLDSWQTQLMDFLVKLKQTTSHESQDSRSLFEI